MLKNNASTSNRIRRRRRIPALLLLLCMSLAGGVLAQPAPDLEAPFKQCPALLPGNGSASIIASDNEHNIYFINSESNIISIDQSARTENWRSQISGKILTDVHIDTGSLYFLTYFEDMEKKRIVSLNSMSLKTGLINWQRKISEFTETKDLRIQNKAPDRKFLYITGDNRLTAIGKDDGKQLWSKSFPLPIRSVEDSRDEKLSVLTDDSMYILYGRTGEETQVRLQRKSPMYLLNNGSDLILGYRTGEIIKTRTQDGRSEPDWNLKTGGGVTGLYEYQNKVLATSLDNFVYMISKENGNLSWKKRVSGRILIRPLIYQKQAVVLTSGDNLATIIDLESGKAVNQIRIEEDNYFSGESYISGRFLILQTFRGVYYFTNTNKNCN